MREARYVSLIPRTTLHSDSEQWIAACNKPNLHAAIHYLSPFSEMFPIRFENEQKPLNKQLTINKQQTTLTKSANK
jgi:hypothetical protein